MLVVVKVKPPSQTFNTHPLPYAMTKPKVFNFTEQPPLFKTPTS